MFYFYSQVLQHTYIFVIFILSFIIECNFFTLKVDGILRRQKKKEIFEHVKKKGKVFKYAKKGTCLLIIFNNCI